MLDYPVSKNLAGSFSCNVAYLSKTLGTLISRSQSRSVRGMETTGYGYVILHVRLII